MSDDMSLGLSSFHQKKDKPNFAKFIKDLIVEMEQTNEKLIVMDNLVSSSNIEKRRLADLFSALTSLGICTRVHVQCYKWESMSVMNETIKQISFALEKRALNMPIAALFDAAHSLSVGDLSLKLLEVFCYFGIPEMTLKSVATVCTINGAGSKQVLRRLYLAAFLLEQLGVLSHSTIRGVYKCELDLMRISQYVFEELIKTKSVPDYAIGMFLNRVDETYVNSIHIRRQMLYSAIITRKKSFSDKTARFDKRTHRPRFAIKFTS